MTVERLLRLIAGTFVLFLRKMGAKDSEQVTRHV